MRRSTVVMILLLVGGWLSAAPHARATADYQYKKNEYVVIDGGLAPSGRVSIAAHGEGEFGSDQFHLYLLAEPQHKVLAPLPSITSETILDSAPQAFYARWAADSRHVAVSFRTSRHVMALLVYDVDGGAIHLVKGASLLSLVDRELREDDYDERTSISQLEWIDSGRFHVKERRLFRSTDELVRRLGGYGRAQDSVWKDASGKEHRDPFVLFSAEAVGRLRPGRRYELEQLKPGSFEENP